MRYMFMFLPIVNAFVFTSRLPYKLCNLSIDGWFLPLQQTLGFKTNEPQHGISNNVVRATSKGSDQPEHTRGLIRAFASRLNNS